MKTIRRNFIGSALTGSLAAALPLTAFGSKAIPEGSTGNHNYAKLDEILKQPLFKKDFSRIRLS
jgi:hypothetical protein